MTLADTFLCVVFLANGEPAAIMQSQLSSAQIQPEYYKSVDDFAPTYDLRDNTYVIEEAPLRKLYSKATDIEKTPGEHIEAEMQVLQKGMALNAIEESRRKGFSTKPCPHAIG